MMSSCEVIPRNDMTKNWNESKGTVLIADDAPDTLSMLNECLAKENYTVLVAMDGGQVLAIAERIVPDIIILDAIMPNLDGFETCKALKVRPELNDVPVIFMTGLSDSEHVLRGLNVGGVDYINKPVNLDELLARVRVHLSNSRKTKSAQNALDEIGQLALACDINGRILWMTVRARKMLGSALRIDESAANITAEVESGLQNTIKHWLQHKPAKDSALTLPAHAEAITNAPIQIRFVSQTSPGEFLLKLSQHNESLTRDKLRQAFALTEREAEVLYWLSQGKTNREVAQILSMSHRTVNKHLEQVYKKLGVENRTAAVALCLKALAGS